MPPSRLSGEASFIKGRSKGLNELLKPFDDVAETNSFLLYVMAKRQKGLMDNNPKLKDELPLTQKEMQQWDYKPTNRGHDKKKKFYY